MVEMIENVGIGQMACHALIDDAMKDIVPVKNLSKIAVTSIRV